MATNNANNALYWQAIVGIVSGHYWQVVAFGTPSFTVLNATNAAANVFLLHFLTDSIWPIGF